MNDLETTKQVSSLTNSELKREAFYPLDEIIKFLLGEGPLAGYYFGEKPTYEEGNYWWRKHLRSALSTEAQPEVTGAVVKFPESFVFVQEVIRHMSLWAEGKVMGSSRNSYDDCYPEKGDIRRVKRTAAFLLPRLKAAFDDLVEFCLLYEKRAPSPSAIQAAVREKLEEAAKVCEENTMSWADDAWNSAVNDCAERIRALMESPHTSVEEPACDTRKGWSRCSLELREMGKPYPRTCRECGLGPCKLIDPHAN